MSGFFYSSYLFILMKNQILRICEQMTTFHEQVVKVSECDPRGSVYSIAFCASQQIAMGDGKEKGNAQAGPPFAPEGSQGTLSSRVDVLGILCV